MMSPPQRPAPRSPARTLAPPERRRFRWAHAAGVLLALCALAADAHAQFDVVLHDADVPGLVDVLRADIARNAVRRQAAGTIGREIQAEIGATLARSEQDPLAYVRERTAHLVLPPDARYDDRCSRALSRANLRPIALYAVGTRADEVGAGLQGKDPKALSNEDMHALMVRQSTSSAGTAFEATIRFYQQRGFALDGVVDSRAVLRWKGPDRDPITAVAHLTNVGAAVDPASCAHLGNTAVLTLSVGDDGASSERSGGMDAARTSMDDADAAFARTLARAGLTQDRYDALVNAALQAQRELQDPHEAAQSDAMGRIPEMRAVADARRRNRAWMVRHRDAIVPLLDEYRSSL